MKPWLRVAFGVFLVFIWLALACLALEVYERIRLYRAAQAYDTYFKEYVGAIPSMVRAGDTGMPEQLHPTPATPLPTPSRVGEATTSSVTQAEPPQDSVAPCNAPRSVPQTPEERESARNAYAQLSEEHRSVIATLRGECEVVLDRTGAYVSSYGDPLVEQSILNYFEGRAINRPAFEVVRILEGASSIERSFTKEFDFTWNHYQATVVPEHGASGQVADIHIRLREQGDSWLFPERDEHVDATRTGVLDVPQLRYRKNAQENYYRTNNFGFMDHDVVMPKPRGQFRIACIGGSTTLEGPPSSPRYSSMLAQTLKERFGETTIDVTNCGVDGINSFGERRRATDYLAIDPNIIVYYDAVNDIAIGDIPVWTERARPWQKALRRSRFLNRWFNRVFLPPKGEVSDLIFRTTLRNLRALCYAARERGVMVAFCSFAYPRRELLDSRARDYMDLNLRSSWLLPSGPYANFASYCAFMDVYNRLLRQTCEQEGVLYIPVAESLHGGMDYFTDVCHMRDAGMSAKADVIAAYLIPCIEATLREWELDKGAVQLAQ